MKDFGSIMKESPYAARSLANSHQIDFRDLKKLIDHDRYFGQLLGRASLWKSIK